MSQKNTGKPVENIADSNAFNAVKLARNTRALYPEGYEGSMLEAVQKAEVLDLGARSKQGSHLGQRPQPFNMTEACRVRDVNEHHSRALRTKISATVGLGHVTEQRKLRRLAEAIQIYQTIGAKVPEKFLQDLPDPRQLQITTDVDDKLNPLCRDSWQETIWNVCDDFWNLGNGYLEVVRAGRRPGSRVVGLHHIPARHVHTYVENDLQDTHYVVLGESGLYGSSTKRFARYGDRNDMFKRLRNPKGSTADRGMLVTSNVVSSGLTDVEDVSEVIHFKNPFSGNRWYGRPDWIAAVASIELHQMVTQHYFDYFHNRGVPEFIALFLGQKIDPKQWETIEQSMGSNVGLGNAFKSVVANFEFPIENFKFQLEKLADTDASEDRFGQTRTNIAEAIVSAHGVPPLLANIIIPGKMGASNEMVQSMQMFQTLTIGPVQRLFQQLLGRTLGGPDSGIDVSTEDFEWATIIDDIDIQRMDTVARMRQDPQEAAREGRDLDKGVKD